MCKLLLDHGANANTIRLSDKLPLIWGATLLWDNVAVESLLMYGAEADICSDDGHTILFRLFSQMKDLSQLLDHRNMDYLNEHFKSTDIMKYQVCVLTVMTAYGVWFNQKDLQVLSLQGKLAEIPEWIHVLKQQAGEIRRTNGGSCPQTSAVSRLESFKPLSGWLWYK